VKLDANESPFPPPDWLRAEVVRALEQVEVNRYPDPRAGHLRAALAARHGVRPECLVLGNGSDELIQLLLLAVGWPGAAVLAPIPTFAMYELIARAQGLRFEGVPLGPRFEPEMGRFIDAIQRVRPAAVFLASPNNPTGGVFSAQQILTVVGAASGLVIVDEAYAPYARQTMLPRVGDHERLVVLRSLSKIGLAGLRVGYLVAHPELASELEKVRLPFNLNAYSQAAAVVALAHHEWVEAAVAEIIRERGRVAERLQELPGVEVFPSEANFILFRTARPCDRVFEALLGRRVLVRNLGSAPGLVNCLRVTIGTREENDRFLDGLRAVMAGVEARGGVS
jgi:histidinol-phosphate aminotransferase